MRLKNWGSRKDENHGEIVRYFEQLKCRVLDISSVPNACDIIVKRGQTVRFVEIKDPRKVPSQRKLTKGEQEFWDVWGDVELVETFADVKRIVEGMA